MSRLQPGTIGWHDLTVADAPGVRDFYQAVAGWRPEPVQMDGYSDFNMIGPATDEPVAGVCHDRGPNAGLPAQWLMYIVVEQLDAALVEVGRLGGAVLHGPRGAGAGRIAVIRDPAGAICALYQPG